MDQVCGIITSIGDTTSHIIVRARALSIPVVRISEDQAIAINQLQEDSPITIISSPHEAAIFKGRAKTKSNENWENLAQMSRITKPFRSIEVRANIDDHIDANKAIAAGADGIGMWRTENFLMRLNHGNLLRQALLDILYGQTSEQSSSIQLIGEEMVTELSLILDSVQDSPTIIRLLDLPLIDMLGEDYPSSLPQSSIVSLLNVNPMLSIRGARLGIAFPGVAEFQLQAVASAISTSINCGNTPTIWVLIPFVVHPSEMVWYRNLYSRIELECKKDHDHKSFGIKFGATIETPRSTIIAAELAKVSDFFSFGTNDLTQYTWAIDRDSGYISILEPYINAGILSVNPFSTFDHEGVGTLIEYAISSGRKTNPNLRLGITGEFGGHLDLVNYFNKIGIDYVSSSVGRLPVVALAYARHSMVSE